MRQVIESKQYMDEFTRMELEEYREEEDYIELYEAMHGWDKANISDLLTAMRKAQKYYLNIPDATRGLYDFFKFFDLKLDNLPTNDRSVLRELKDIVRAIDDEGMCLLIIDAEKEFSLDVAHISKLIKL